MAETAGLLYEAELKKMWEAAARVLNAPCETERDDALDALEKLVPEKFIAKHFA